MKNLLFKALILLSILSTHASCIQRGKPSMSEAGDTLQMKYATLLHIVRYEDYTVVSIDNPWKEGKTLHKYVLLEKGRTPSAELPKGTVIHIPATKNVVFNTAHCQLMDWLGARSQLSGITDLKYILVPFVKEGVSKGIIEDCGDGMSPVVEKIIDMKPDLIMLSPFENSGGYGRLDDINIPLVECADYMERSALARAEWMRFYGLLLGKSEEADSLFAIVDSSYNALKELAKKSTDERSILTEKLTGSTWYVPGGKSSIGGIISDANGTYPWKDDKHGGSLAMTFESVLDKAGNSDVWIFNYFGSGHLTYDQLSSEFQGYQEIKAFKTKETWYVDTQRTPYFEEVSFRPDYLLRDYIILLHPTLGLGKPRYYTPVYN